MTLRRCRRPSLTGFGEDNEQDALRVQEKVRKRQLAVTLLCSPVAGGEQEAEPPVGSQVRQIGRDLRRTFVERERQPYPTR